MPVSIAVLGSVNLDFVIRTPRLPQAGETVSGGTFLTTPGGKGGNQALAARKLGACVDLYACVGDDAYAADAMANLSAAGVGLGGVIRRSEVKTGAAFICVDDAGENHIAVASGANAAFTSDIAPQIDAAWIIAQLEVSPETLLAAAQKTPAKLCINAAPVRPLPRDLWAKADLVVVNEIEFEYYKDDLASLDCLVALTLGAKGAVLLQSGKEIAAATPPKVKAIDTTGAGDCFVAALTVFLAEGLSQQSALEAACHCGALATTQLGAQAATPSRADLLAAYPALVLG